VTTKDLQPDMVATGTKVSAAQ